MLLGNIDQTNDLCNGTRLQLNNLGNNVIVVTVIIGKTSHQHILILRMDLVTRKRGLPLKFQRRQLPISLCFVMTINKSKG